MDKHAGTTWCSAMNCIRHLGSKCHGLSMTCTSEEIRGHEVPYEVTDLFLPNLCLQPALCTLGCTQYI